MEHVEQVVKDYITKQFMTSKPDTVLTNDMHLIEEGIVDSLGILLLVTFIQKEFAIKVQPEDIVFDHFKTIDAIKHFIVSRVQS
jgi:acyl carrier protein